jgi:thiamine biosynthesis lipoprotein
VYSAGLWKIGLLIAVAVAGCAGCVRRPALETLTGLAQGTTYTLQWWSDQRVDRAALARDVTAELERIDALLSNYRPDSVLERFNATRSPDPQALPAELVALFELAAEIHRASAGCFDPTVRPLVRLWGFDGDEPHVPPDDAIAAVLPRVGFDKLEIVDPEHVRKLREDLEIDMASIGQGYTVGRLSAIAEGFGLKNYLFEIGGELAGRGTRPDGNSWRVGIESPDRGDPLEALNLPADRLTAVITSGSYRHFFEDHGHAYGHILDPRTGRSVEHALVSVTVTGDTAARTAAWGTALLCLGPDAAAETAEREHVSAIMIVRAGAAFEIRRSSLFAEAWPTDPGQNQPRRLKYQ